MIGVCIPAHDEERHIAACLRAVMAAARHPLLRAEPVRIVVVLDHCRDLTAKLAGAWPVCCLTIGARNVGIARDVGSRHLLAAGARWLAHTDADTVVSARWLVDQLSLNADVVCGTVAVSGWAGHRHVHGANLGIDARAYQRIGGFTALACSEDQALVDRLALGGCRIAWSALPRVTTSARPYSRVEGGFATALRSFDATPAPCQSTALNT